MQTRWAAGLILALVLALVVAGPAPAPAASDDLTSAQLCDLLPQDRGFTFTEDAARPMCQGQAGDCGGGVPTGEETCISVVVLQYATADEASVLYQSGAAVWEPLSGLGESAVGACQWWCEVRFHRERFWVSASSATPLGLDVAEQLAAQTDRAIEQFLASGSEPEDPGEEPQEPEDPGEEPEDPGTASGIVDVFFGADRIRAMEPDILRELDCTGSAVDESYLECRGAAAGVRQKDAFWAAFFEEYPNPTDREVLGASAYMLTLLLTGMVRENGTPLFPSVGAARPVIEALDNPAAAIRFVEMLAAMDAADW